MSNRALSGFGNFIFLPIYFRLFDLDEIGQIVFYYIICGAVGVLDFGITNIVTTKLSIHRDELVKNTTINEGRRLIKNILLTFMVPVVFIILNYSSAHDFLVYGLMVLAIFVQIQFNYVANVIYATNKIELSNIVQLVVNFLKYCIPIAMFIFLKPTVGLFLLAQAMCASIGLYYILSKIRIGKVESQNPKREIKIKLGFKEISLMSVLGILSYALSNIDKFYLKATVDHVGFLAYSMSSMLASLPIIITSVFCLMFYPQWVSDFNSNRKIDLLSTPLKIAALSGLYCLIISLFADDIIYALTKDVDVADHSQVIVPILAVTQTIQAITMPYYFYSLANGLIGLNIKTIIMSTAILVGALLYFYGNASAELIAIMYCLAILIPLPIYLYVLTQRLYSINDQT